MFYPTFFLSNDVKPAMFVTGVNVPLGAVGFTGALTIGISLEMSIFGAAGFLTATGFIAEFNPPAGLLVGATACFNLLVTAFLSNPVAIPLPANGRVLVGALTSPVTGSTIGC
jgi:hypothetical protein